MVRAIFQRMDILADQAETTGHPDEDADVVVKATGRLEASSTEPDFDELKP